MKHLNVSQNAPNGQLNALRLWKKSLKSHKLSGNTEALLE